MSFQYNEYVGATKYQKPHWALKRHRPYSTQQATPTGFSAGWYVAVLKIAAQTGSAMPKIKRPLFKVSELTRQTIHPFKVHEANVFNMSKHNETITTNTPQEKPCH